MKHSASGSMTDPCKEEVEIPSEGNCQAVLQELYIDLCNLIVESRIPGINERGYGDGSHCPPLLGPNTHQCDFSLPECQKHQRLIQYLLQAVECNVFEIEVLMLPDCCAEPKLTERIQNGEYLLLERWSMKCISNKVQSTIEIPQLLRAVRSFLHFSQLSAWLSSTRGKSPANIYYWIKPSIDDSTTKFDQEPEEHFFPVCKISDGLFGYVTVQYPSRTQYIPVIPCSKHPPLRTYSFRNIDENPRLSSNIPFNSDIVKQLQRTHDTSQSPLSAKNYLPESTTLVLTPTSLLKTFATKLSDGKISNRVLKHSNSQTNVIDSSDLTIDSDKNQNINISNTETAYVVCNYAETCPEVHSQENCFNKRELAMHLCRARLKEKILNKNITNNPAFKIVTEPLQYSSELNPTDNFFSPTGKCCTISPLVSDSETITSAKVTSPIKNTEISLEEDTSCRYHQENLSKDFKKRKSNAFKRKRTSTHFETLSALPPKKSRCDTNISSQQFNSLSYNIDQTTLSFSVNNKVGNTKCDSSMNVEPNLLEHCIETEAYNCGSYKAASEMGNNLQQIGYNSSNQSSSNTVSEKAKVSEENHNSWSKKRKFHDNFIKKSMKKQHIDLNTSKLNISKDLNNFTQPNDELILKKRCKISSSKCKYYSNLSFDSSDNINLKSEWCNKFCKTDLPYIASSDYVSLQADINNFKHLVKNENCVPQEEEISEGTRTFQYKRDINLSKCKVFKVKRTPKSVCKLKNFTYKMGISVRRKYRLYQKRKCISRYIFSYPFGKPKSYFHKDVHAKSNVCKELQFNEGIQNALHNYEVTVQKNSEFNSYTADSITSNANALQKTCDIRTLKNRAGTQLSKKAKCVTSGKFNKNLKSVKKIQKKECEPGSNKASNLILRKQIETDSLLNAVNGSSNALESHNTAENDNSSHKQGFEKLYNHKSTNIQNIHEKKNKTSGLDVSSECGNNCLTSATACFKTSKNFMKSNYSDDKAQGTSQNPSVDYVTMPLKISTPKANLSASLVNRPLGAYRTSLYHSPNKNLECFPRHTTKFPKGQKLLGNFEESILKGCLPTVCGVKGFHAEIGASGSFCPNHLTLPADVHFYDLGNPNQGAAPYVAHINLENAEYYLPKKGAVQVTLFNPSETVVKMFVLNYDLSNMPPMCHTFIRQKIYYLPVGSTDEYPSSPKWLRFIIHLRFASNKSGKILLHKNFKIVVLNKSNDDAASEFSQEPRELRSFLSVPMNPTFSLM